MKKYLTVLFLIFFTFVFIENVFCLSDGGYDLSWYTIDNGGGDLTSAGNQYILNGTIGQTDISVLTGGNYSLSGGFWSGIISPVSTIDNNLWFIY